MLARAGAKVSISPGDRAQHGHGPSRHRQVPRRSGIKPTPELRHHLAQLRRPVHPDAPGAGRISGSRTTIPSIAGCAMPTALTLHRPRRPRVGDAERRRGAAVSSPGSDRCARASRPTSSSCGGDSFAMRPRPETVGSLVFQATAHDVRTVLVAGNVVKRDGALRRRRPAPGVLERAEQSAERGARAGAPGHARAAAQGSWRRR